MDMQSWAFSMMVRHNLCVDFYANKITDTEDNEWYWQGVDIEDFYSLLEEVVASLPDGDEE
jgi:hypothetical protein